VPSWFRAISPFVVVVPIVWALAPRGLGLASVERTSRTEGWALFLNRHRGSVAFAVAGDERDRASTFFVYAHLWPDPALLLGGRSLAADDLVEDSAERVILPRRVVSAVDLVSGRRSGCALELTVSRLEIPTRVSALICGTPFSTAEAIAASVQRTTELRDAVP